uniref:Hir1 n=1 Tax=Arundo donax TaxID=35708 RepID=A0A0A9EJC3_ARUDO
MSYLSSQNLQTRMRIEKGLRAPVRPRLRRLGAPSPLEFLESEVALFMAESLRVGEGNWGLWRGLL